MWCCMRYLRRKKDEERRMKEEGRRTKEGGRRKKDEEQPSLLECVCIVARKEECNFT